jgi:hypothetical protein
MNGINTRLFKAVEAAKAGDSCSERLLLGGGTNWLCLRHPHSAKMQNSTLRLELFRGRAACTGWLVLRGWAQQKNWC